jgi:hypothetical protein
MGIEEGEQGLHWMEIEDCEKELGWQMEKGIENTVLMKRS